MVKGLYTAYTGMTIEQKRMDILTNNLANADTNGYKKEGSTAISFADTLAVKIKDTSTANLPQGLGEITFGAKIGETYTNWDQGSLNVTDSPADLAIEGDGFFAISFTDKQGNTSVKYTRDGAFAINTDGYIVTKDGDFLLNPTGAANADSTQRVQIDPTKTFTIDSQGNIWQDGAIVAQVGVIDIVDYNYLQEYGENMYDLVDGGARQASTATIIQGAIEMSNVNVIDEMVDLITVSRAYESNQKVIQTIDSTLEIATKQIGKL